MKPRQSHSPKRRIAPAECLTPEERGDLRARMRDFGSAYHKRHPADYPFPPPAAPRSRKSVCDDLPVIPWAEARQLLQSGLPRGLVSPSGADRLPTYVWAVAAGGEAYEVKIGSNAQDHGYRPSAAYEGMLRQQVLSEWSKRHVR